jgi:hypothetical protein
MLTKRVICLMLLLTSGSAYSGDLAGQASIIDGDTLEIHGTRIRVWGIDAPESSLLCRGNDSLQYRCGARAANELAAMVGGRPVICQPVSLDRYGRTVASCAVAGTDLAEWLNPANSVRLSCPQIAGSSSVSQGPAMANRALRRTNQSASQSGTTHQAVEEGGIMKSSARRTPRPILQSHDWRSGSWPRARSAR